MKATWKGETLAESDDTVIVEGNHYFPPDSVRQELFVQSGKTTVCTWKGTARYYHVVLGNKKNPDAAWYYPVTRDAAKHIEGRIAFWRGVEVSE